MIAMRISRFVAVLAISFLSLGANRANAFDTLNAFGDSLSDAGNSFHLSGVPPSPPYDQRFSNGPVAVEQLASGLGISSFAASWAGGTDYAVGGAETGTSNYLYETKGVTPLANTGMLNQVGSFVSSPPTFDPAMTLFFVWGGPNDIFTALETDPTPTNVAAAVTQAVVNLTNEVGMLASVGAQHFLVPNMPDLGLTPDGLSAGPPNAALLTGLSQSFNDGLSSAMESLKSTYGLDIRMFDTFGFLHSVVDDPTAFGFTNVQNPCFNGATVCSNPDEYLFWDGVHPTTRADQFLASGFMVATVPEPETYLMLLVGLGLMGFVMRRRKWSALAA